MTRAGLILILLAPTCVWAQTPTPPAPPPLVPHAVIKGPSGTVPARGAVMLDASASVCDPERPLQWKVLEPPDLSLALPDPGGRIAMFVTDPRPGAEYLVGVTATAVGPVDADPQTGKPKVDVRTDTALIRVRTDPPAPPPSPVPPPLPPPGPSPGPAPGPVPLPVPTSPLALAAQQYYAGFPGMLRSIGDRVRGGTLPDKQSAIAAVSAYTVPLARALDAAFAPHIDTVGKFTNPTAIQAALYDAAAATGGP